MIRITEDDAYTIISFVKMHEKYEIPEELWDIIMRLQDEVEDE